MKDLMSGRPARLTRRQLATLLTPAAALAQTPAQAPVAPADELKAARDRVRANGERLGRETVPMATEPAFQFKA